MNDILIKSEQIWKSKKYEGEYIKIFKYDEKYGRWSWGVGHYLNEEEAIIKIKKCQENNHKGINMTPYEINQKFTLLNNNTSEDKNEK